MKIEKLKEEKLKEVIKELEDGIVEHKKRIEWLKRDIEVCEAKIRLTEYLSIKLKAIESE
jgi:hypothetical protein